MHVNFLRQCVVSPLRRLPIRDGSGTWLSLNSNVFKGEMCYVRLRKGVRIGEYRFK